ncbi:tyrosine-type recombinase/integrase [Micromonosporaceae bacterium B7E4]
MTADLVPVQPAGHRARLGQFVEAFLEVQTAGTARTYRYALTAWLNWCDQQGVDPLNAVPAHGQLWLASMDSRYTDATRGNRLSAVRSFYEWLEENEVPFRRNPAKVRNRPKQNSRPTPALSVDQRNRILTAADNEHRHPHPGRARHGARTAAIVWVLFTTGLRISEVLSATEDDLGQDAGHNVISVIGKGRKRQTTPLIPATWDRIQAYRTGRTTSTLPTTTVGNRPARPLFATSTGRRLTPNAVRTLIRRLAVEAGVPAEVAEQISPHVTRATYITLSLAAGKTLQEVQRAVNHSSPTTTQGYDRSHLAHDRHPSYALMADLPTTDPAPR